MDWSQHNVDEDVINDYYGFGKKKTNKQKFADDTKERKALKGRMALPAQRRIKYEKGMISLYAYFPNNDAWFSVGYLGYCVGSLEGLYRTDALIATAPELLGPT